VLVAVETVVAVGCEPVFVEKASGELARRLGPHRPGRLSTDRATATGIQGSGQPTAVIIVTGT